LVTPRLICKARKNNPARGSSSPYSNSASASHNPTPPARLLLAKIVALRGPVLRRSRKRKIVMALALLIRQEWCKDKNKIKEK